MSVCEKRWRLPPCKIQPVPTSSKRYPLLPNVKPVRNTGSVSAITYLRKSQKHCAVAVRERSEKNVGETMKKQDLGTCQG